MVSCRLDAPRSKIDHAALFDTVTLRLQSITLTEEILNLKNTVEVLRIASTYKNKYKTTFSKCKHTYDGAKITLKRNQLLNV